MPRYSSAISAVGRQLLAGRVAPELAAHALVHALGEGLGQPVGQRLQHDAAVVVGRVDVAGERLGLADAGRDGEGADVVGEPALLGRDEIGQRRVGPVGPVLARHLLAQRVQHGESATCAPSSAYSSMSSPTALAGQKPITALAVSHLLLDQPLQHGLRVVEQLLGFGTDHVVLEDAGILALQLPGLEEGRPVDVGHQLGQLVALERAGADQLRRRRDVARPVDLEPVVACGRQRQARLLGLALEIGVADLHVLLAHVVHVRAAIGVVHQGRHHAHRAARVRDVDGLPAQVVGRDLHRRVHAAGGGAADQQRHVEALALHLGRHVAHLVERGRDQPRQADDVGLLALGGLQDLLPPAPSRRGRSPRSCCTGARRRRCSCRCRARRP